MKSKLLLANLKSEIRSTTINVQDSNVLVDKDLDQKIQTIAKVLKHLKKQDIITYLLIRVEDKITYKELKKYQEYIYDKISSAGIHPKDIHIQWIDGLGENAEQLLLYYDELFSDFLQKYGFPELYILTQTSNVLSQSTLFMEALKHWGNRVHPVWVQDKNVIVYDLNHIYPRKTTKQLLLKWLKSYDYHAIIKLLDLEDFTHDAEERVKVECFIHTVKSIMARFNYDFQLALKHWIQAKPLFESNIVLWEETKNSLEALTQRENAQQSALAKVVELSKQLSVYLEMKDIPAFLIRLYVSVKLYPHGKAFSTPS